MATPIDPQRRAAMDALLGCDWADTEENAAAMVDCVIKALERTGWDRHVDTALAAFNEPTDADVVTLYDERDATRPYGHVNEPHPVDPGDVLPTHPWTVSGEFNRMLDHEVTEETVRRLINETGEESANYIVEHYLIRDKRWSHVRFDSESGNFFAYTKTREEAQELLDYILGLTWTVKGDN